MAVFPLIEDIKYVLIIYDQKLILCWGVTGTQCLLLMREGEGEKEGKKEGGEEGKRDMDRHGIFKRIQEST